MYAHYDIYEECYLNIKNKKREKDIKVVSIKRKKK